MADWTIQVEHLSRGGWNWVARIGNEIVLSNSWNSGEFVSKESCVHDAIREINAYEVLQTERCVLDTYYYDMRTNG